MNISLAQAMLLALVVGVGMQVGIWLTSTIVSFTSGVFFGIVNRRAAMLRVATIHCAKCAVPCHYQCSQCWRLYMADGSPIAPEPPESPEPSEPSAPFPPGDKP